MDRMLLVMAAALAAMGPSAARFNKGTLPGQPPPAVGPREVLLQDGARDDGLMRAPAHGSRAPIHQCTGAPHLT